MTEKTIHSRDLVWDEKTGILKCKIVGSLSDDEARELATDLIHMVKKVRNDTGRLRLLFDNQQGAVFSNRSAAAIQHLKTLYTPGDRTAVLMSEKLNILPIGMIRSEGRAMFTSEFEAVAWLIS